MKLAKGDVIRLSSRQIHVDSFLSAGTEGQVYKVTDVRTRENGALKVFNNHMPPGDRLQRINYLVNQHLDTVCPSLCPPIDALNVAGLVGHYSPFVVGHTLEEHMGLLGKLLDVLSVTMIELVETAFAPAQKAMLYNCMKQDRKEGVVLKRLDAPYTPGRPNSGGPQLKHKFVATLSAVVAKINAQRNVEVRLLNGKGWIPCGNVTIPPNQPVPHVGAVVEIRYLYAFKESNVLYQPVFLGVRTDVEQHECVVSQLKYKSEDDEG
jgi:hypothetical protein